jgi:hypothetical protein
MRFFRTFDGGRLFSIYCPLIKHAVAIPLLRLLSRVEWQELAGDRLGWRKMLKSTKIRTQLVLQVQDRRWIERKMPR